MANEPTATVIAYYMGSIYQGAVKFDGCGCDNGMGFLSAYLRCGHNHRKRAVALKCGEEIRKKAQQALAKSED